MNQPLVFVGGIHGVGKTTVCRLLAELLPAEHVTAGALIRKTAMASETVVVGVGNKAVPDVARNQSLLLRGLDVYRAGAGAAPILLDGHFSLLEPSGAVVDISMSVFAALGPVAVLLIEAAHEVVYGRLVQRDSAAPPLAIISLLAERERACAIQVCAALNIPLWTASGDTVPGQAAEAAASRLRALLAGAT